jgi:hypothetical protein
MSESQSYIESFCANAQKPPDEGSVADSVSKGRGLSTSKEIFPLLGRNCYSVPLLLAYRSPRP